VVDPSPHAVLLYRTPRLPVLLFAPRSEDRRDLHRGAGAAPRGSCRNRTAHEGPASIPPERPSVIYNGIAGCFRRRFPHSPTLPFSHSLRRRIETLLLENAGPTDSSGGQVLCNEAGPRKR